MRLRQLTTKILSTPEKDPFTKLTNLTEYLRDAPPTLFKELTTQDLRDLHLLIDEHCITPYPPEKYTNLLKTTATFLVLYMYMTTKDFYTHYENKSGKLSYYRDFPNTPHINIHAQKTRTRQLPRILLNGGYIKANIIRFSFNNIKEKLEHVLPSPSMLNSYSRILLPWSDTPLINLDGVSLIIHNKPILKFVHKDGSVSFGNTLTSTKKVILLGDTSKGNPGLPYSLIEPCVLPDNMVLL